MKFTLSSTSTTETREELGGTASGEGDREDGDGKVLKSGTVWFGKEVKGSRSDLVPS